MSRLVWRRALSWFSKKSMVKHPSAESLNQTESEPSGNSNILFASRRPSPLGKGCAPTPDRGERERLRVTTSHEKETFGAPFSSAFSISNKTAGSKWNMPATKLVGKLSRAVLYVMTLSL